MYDAALAAPDGPSTVARLARTAARQGFEGLVVRNAAAAGLDCPVGVDDGAERANEEENERSDDESETPDAAAITAEYGVDLVDAATVETDDPSVASGHVGNLRPDRTLLVVEGGGSINDFATRQEKVDVLGRPTRGEESVDHVLVKTAREHGVRLEFDFGPVLRASGGRRVRAISRLRRLREIVEHYDAPYVISARADSHLELRAPRELVALGEQLGFEPADVEAGLREWGRLAERNRERHSATFIEPGVKRGRYEEDDR